MNINNNNKKSKSNRINSKSLLLKKGERKGEKKEKLKLLNIFINLNIPRESIRDILFGILVVVINIIILTINIYFLFIKKNILKKFNGLKDIDQFIFILLTNSFTKIGKYLNDKYNIPYNKKPRKEIRVFGVNINSQEEFRKTLLWYIKDKFIVKFDPYYPTYLIYNVFGYNELDPKYRYCIKIAIYTENTIPDLSVCDYALGHQHISYLDRYFTLPFCFLRKLNETKNISLEKIRHNVLKRPKRRKFCAALITNIHPYLTDYFRVEFIEELSKYKKVDMGGRYKNNVGGRVKNKMKFLLDYKFSIAMENTNGDGYISEKIIESFMAGTIPIYYGSYMIEEYINPKAFILINGPKDMHEKIEYIKKIDNDDKLYKSILKEKVFINDKILEKSHKEQSDFWTHIFEQDIQKAKRINIHNYF